MDKSHSQCCELPSNSWPFPDYWVIKWSVSWQKTRKTHEKFSIKTRQLEFAAALNTINFTRGNLRNNKNISTKLHSSCSQRCWHNSWAAQYSSQTNSHPPQGQHTSTAAGFQRQSKSSSVNCDHHVQFTGWNLPAYRLCPLHSAEPSNCNCESTFMLVT